ncbi:MAG: 4-hydroxythreonine-4-phosphate dehydrogenase PdxA [Sedimentisphaerales bacterium]|nr:4-hydroxythreonine-4-phosphate dehydrogenase PdxA [Sedimentisphaerales bacterium]
MMRSMIGMTMGDPAGIGSELCVRVLSREDVYQKCKPLVVGDARCIQDAIRFTGIDTLDVHPVSHPSEGKYVCGTIDVLDLKNVNMDKLVYGKVSAMCGRASGEYIVRAIKLALAGELDATVTCPIHKESFKLGGYGEKYPGHTEMFADLTGTEKYSMMLAHGNLRTVHVTTHVSLRQACDLVKKERVLDVIEIAHNACRALGIDEPKIGVAGLNPHAGDGKIFGIEEAEEIIPAIQEAQSRGYCVDGPVPADTLYSKVKGGWYDIAVSMYHDQGHIPLKLAGFVWDEENGQWASVAGVNVTLGLPIIRVSVDHGTAFGKAGQGRANVTSLLNAIDYAVKFAGNKSKSSVKTPIQILSKKPITKKSITIR